MVQRTWGRRYRFYLDVQGAESDVFKGGMNALAKTRFIYTEYSDVEQYEGQSSLQQLLSQLTNFKILIRYYGDVLFKNKQFVLSPNKTL